MIELIFVSEWFREKELAFALGCNVIFGNAGAFTADNTMVHIFNWKESVPLCLWFGVGILFIAFLCFILLSLQDRYAEKTGAFQIEVKTRMHGWM